MSTGFIITGIMMLSTLAMFVRLECSQTFSTKTIAVIATLASLAGVFRIPFAALPNIQPTTFLVMSAGYVFGPSCGFFVGSIATLVSNTFLGQGPWTPWQMFSWGLAGTFAGWLNRRERPFSRWRFAIWLFAWGFIFDYIMNLWHWLYFIYPHTLRSFIATYAASIMFDLAHATGNFIFAYFFGNDIILILSRFKKKIEVIDQSFERIERHEKSI